MAADRVYGARPSRGAPELAVGSALTLPVPSGAWSVREWCTYVDNQNGNRCVGEMLRGMHCIAVRGAGKRLSARGAYVNGRAREVSSAKGAPIPDAGSNVSDVIDAAIEVGIFPEDERENDPNTTELEAFAESSASVLVPPACFVPVPRFDTFSIDVVGASGSGIGFWMPVYPSFEALRGKAIWSGPKQGETPVGNHAQVLCQRLTLFGVDVYDVWGSWGAGFADGGHSYIPCEWIALNGHDFVGMTGGPTL